MADREMTNEEAIEILSDIRACYNIFDEYDEPKYAALSKAIFALKAEPIEVKAGYEQKAYNDGYYDGYRDGVYGKAYKIKGGGENASKVELDYSQICWASAKCKYRTRNGNCKLDHCVR